MPDADDAVRTNHEATPGGFSVGGLILLVAIASSCFALTEGAALTEGLGRLAQGDSKVVVGAVVLLVFGVLYGGVAGLIRLRKWSGYAVGAAAGGVAACLVAAITVAPIELTGIPVIVLVTLVAPMLIRAGAG